MKNRLTKKDKLYYKDGGFFNKVGEQINTGIANIKDTTVKDTFGEIGDQANKVVKNNTNFKNVNELGAEALKYGKDAAVIGGLGFLQTTGMGVPISALTGKSLDNLVGYEAETKAGKLAQRGTQTMAGLQGAAAPMAANIFAPGSGAVVSAAQQGIGNIGALNNPNQAQSFLPQGVTNSAVGMASQFMEHGGKLTQFKGGIKGKTDSIEIMPGVMVNHGETAMKTPQGDFVINSTSDKVKMALGGINPAKESKKIEKLRDFRKNDLLTQNMTNKFQNNLSSLSAKIGSLLNPDAAGYEDNGVEEYKYGGIHIKESNKGKFTASAKAAGRSVQEHAHAVVNNPNSTELQRKRAQFAINAKKWHHEDGGMLKYDNGGEYDSETTANEFEQLGGTRTEPNLNMVEDSIDNTPTTYVPERIKSTVDAYGNPISSKPDYNQIASYATLGLGALAKSYPMIQELRRLKKDTPETVAYNRIKYDDIAAKTVDPRAALAQAGQENRTTDYNMRQASAGNLGSYLSNMSAARLANARNKTNINYEYDKANAGIMNQAAQFNAANRLNTAQYNAAIGDKESDINSQTRANYENQMFKLRQGLGDTAASALNTANTQYFGDKFNQKTNQQNAAMYGSLYNTPEFQAFIKNNPKYFTQ